LHTEIEIAEVNQFEHPFLINKKNNFLRPNDNQQMLDLHKCPSSSKGIGTAGPSSEALILKSVVILVTHENSISGKA
jgi:hypothetical protein